MKLAETTLFDGLVRIWATCDRLRNGCCEVCAAKIKISQKDLIKSFKESEYYVSVEYFAKRFLTAKKLKQDLENHKFKNLIQFAETVKREFDFPARPYSAVEAGNYLIVVKCPKCMEPYTIRIDFRLDKRVFMPISGLISWFDVIRNIPESGNEYIDFRLRKYLHGDYREVRERVFKEVAVKRYGLLHDLVAKLKELLRLNIDFWCPPALENRPVLK